MIKRNLFAVMLAVGATGVASAYDFDGADWKYNFSGHYSIANVDANNNGLIGNVLGVVFNLSAQLNLINGTTSATNYGTTINQSALTNFSVNDLHMSATNGGGLLPSLGNFVYNLLDFSNGVYMGTEGSGNVTLTRGSLLSADLFALVDTRVIGTGVVLDLRAAIPTSTLTGTVTGVDGGPSGPYGGGRANYITGDSGLMDTIAIQARARAYVANIATLDTGYLNVGAIENRADMWSLSRSPQAVPEPASLLGIGAGIVGFVRRRRKNKAI